MGRTVIIFHTCIRMLVASILIFAAIVKAVDPSEFQQQILAYQIVGYKISFFASYLLPSLEFSLGVGLLFRLGYRQALQISMFLFAVFTIALTYTWIAGLDISCGCFGKFDFVSKQLGAIIRDIVILIFLVFLMKSEVVASRNIDKAE